MTTRKTLLQELKNNQNEFLSGTILSKMLGISRAAISKHVSTLRKEGYEIEAIPRVGYRLVRNTSFLLPEEIKNGLTSRLIGQNDIIHYHQTSSTNDRAKEFAAQGFPDGTLVIAETQTQGRGRKGRSWFSGSGDTICLSIIMRPPILPSKIPPITLMTAVALSEALLETTPITPAIKWPNDILVNGKKLAGILTEASMELDLVDYIVIGVGLNVTTPMAAFHKSIENIATSIYCETGTIYDRGTILRAFLKRLDHHYFDVIENGFASVIDRFKTLTNTIGKQVTVDTQKRQIKGTITDIDANGTLILQDKKGDIHPIISGDVLL